MEKKPYVSSYVQLKEKKQLKVGTVGASVIVAGTLLASNGSNIAFAEKIDALVQPIHHGFQEFQASKFLSEKNDVETKHDIHIEINNKNIKMTEEIQEAVAELSQLIDQQTFGQSTVPSFEVIVDPAHSVAFEPTTVYGKNYEKNDFPLLATLSKDEVNQFSNTMIRPIAASSNDSIIDAFAPDSTGGFHHGIDYPASNSATPVYAAADGTVLYSGAATGYGNWIVLEHTIEEEKIYSIYGHLANENLFVKQGDVVKQGDTISMIGSEGNTERKELHFSIANERDAQEGRLFYGYINPAFFIDEETSQDYAYETYEATESKSYTEDDFWQFAQEAAEILQWDPYLIYSQWQLETAHFTSNNFLKNNNIAGQTWTKNMPEASKGTARPSKEGGHYIRYSDPVEGYVDFVQSNPRYNEVKNMKTAEEQAIELKASGWAVDPDYANTLISMIQGNQTKRFLTSQEPVSESVSEPAIELAVSEPDLDHYQKEATTFSYKGTEALGEKIKNNTEFLLADLTSETTALISNSLVSPVDLTNNGHYLSSDFGWRDIGDGQEFHKGIDLAAPNGTDIYAPKDGVVVWSGHPPIASYGTLVVLEHTIEDEEGETLRFYTSYAHMEQESILVSVGDVVKQGQKIAEVGNEGRSTGNHLHFATHFGFDEVGNLYNLVDPMLFLQMETTTKSKEIVEVSTDEEDELPFILEQLQ